MIRDCYKNDIKLRLKVSTSERRKRNVWIYDFQRFDFKSPIVSDDDLHLRSKQHHKINDVFALCSALGETMTSASRRWTWGNHSPPLHRLKQKDKNQFDNELHFLKFWLTINVLITKVWHVQDIDWWFFRFFIKIF